ncbi:MAG: sugar phosphate isomerase/epimerase [Phycisphaerales bacterium]|nr:sugar phosphate isomerase/epimerase [Phycisphaerales bacterium]
MQPLTPDRLAIHTMTTKPWSLAEACEHYATAGVAGICPWVEHVKPVGADEAARIIRDSGLRVPAYVRGGFFVHADAAERAAAIERTRGLIEEARTLNAEMLVIVAGARPGVPLDDARAMAADALAALAEHASRAGVRLALEPLHPMYAADRSCINTVRSARDLCDRVSHPALVVAVDVYHTWWEPGLAEQIAALGREQRLAAFHICDFKAEFSDVLLDRGLMGEGVVPIPDIRRAVENAGFTGLVEVEIFSTRYWAEDQHHWLARILDAAREHA